MAKILLTDCWTRKTLSAVRSLGKEGLEVYAVSHKRIAPAIYSKYVKQYFILPDPTTKPEKYLEDILKLLKKEKFDCLIPFEESSIEIFLKARKEIEALTVLPLALASTYEIANNKNSMMQVAVGVGVPVPRSFLLNDEAEAVENFKHLHLPMILKPTKSSGSRGIYKITDEKDLLPKFRKIKERYGAPLLQECIPQEGEGVGVGLLAENGKVLVSFSYKRLREFPVNGGPSTLRESTNDPEIINYAEKLIAELNWDGVAMVEFKRDPRDGKPKLMEINPRFWGSLHLAYVSGINFPFLLYKWSQGIKIEQPIYNKGVKCRWLLPGDVAHFISSRKRVSMKPSFFKFRGMYYDDFMKGDLKGNWASWWCTFLSIFDIDTWKKGVFRK